MSASATKRQKAVERLRALGQTEQVEIVQRNGLAVKGYVRDVDATGRSPALYYATMLLDDEGSKFEPPHSRIALRDLGYVKAAGRKISLVPFHY